MNTKIRRSLLLMMGMGLSSTLLYTPHIAAQDEEVIEEVITIGTRRKARSAADSPAPVDVVSGSELTNQADNDLSNICLLYTSPSPRDS